MSSDDLRSLHDVYEGLDDEENCHKTTYILQFLWRDLSSDFDVLGPYFTLSKTAEARYLHPMVTKAMLVFHQYGFHVRCLLCDGASSNLSLLKQFCGARKDEDEITETKFTSPLDGKNVHVMVCPSHQVSPSSYILYHSYIA